MRIRYIKKEDVGEAVTMLERCHKEMDFDSSGMSYDPTSAEETLEHGIEDQNICIVVAIDNGKIGGVGGVTITPSYMNYNDRIAHEFIWHSDPLLRPYKRAKIFKNLFEIMQAWAKVREVSSFQISVSPFGKNKAAGKFLEKKGLKLRNYIYMEV